MLIADAEWSVIGTTNMDNRSFEHNDEVNMVTLDRDLTTRLCEDFERDLHRLRRGDVRRLAIAPALGEGAQPLRVDSRTTAIMTTAHSHAPPPRRPHRHLQHPSLPRPRRPDAPAAHRRRAPADRGGRDRLAGSARPGRGDRRRARHGLGDGLDAPASRPGVRQRGDEPPSDQGTPAVRPVVSPVRAALRAARRRADRPRTACTSSTSTSARRCWSAAIRRDGCQPSSTITA